jgi:hypothetical protein
MNETSNVEVADRGAQSLEGVPDRWEVYAAQR